MWGPFLLLGIAEILIWLKQCFIFYSIKNYLNIYTESMDRDLTAKSDKSSSTSM